MRYTYSIIGMHCSSCVDKIKTALSSQVELVEITLHPPMLRIEAKKTPQLAKLNASISKAGQYQLQSIMNENEAELQPLPTNDDTQKGLWAYYPIFLILFYILGVSAFNNVHFQGINWHGLMSQFMAGFFLIFSAFKLLDIRGFAEGYASYDLLARQWYPYGFIYPFIELSLGVLYLTNWFPISTQILTIIIMGFSSLGVINSLLKKQKIRCACLGTILKVPLSSITLIEDLVMVIMAALTLLSF